MTKRQGIISVVLTLLILILGAVGFTTLKSKKESTVSAAAPTQEIRKVSVSNYPTENIKNEIEVDGRITAYEKINIAAEVQGRLLSTEKTLKEGTNFSKGDLLFQIESRDEVFNLKAQRSQLFSSITQIMPDLKFDYPQAFEKWKTYLDQFDINQSIKPLPEISNNQEKYFIGGKNIHNQYYTIKSQEERLKQYQVYAPFSGVFLSVNAFPGSIVSPGANLGQIMNTYHYEMVSPISMENLKYVSAGQSVKLFSEALNQSYYAKVNRTSKQIDQTTQSIPVYISVSGKGLRDGMYLKGSVSGGNLKEVSTIPSDILVNQNHILLYQDSLVVEKEIEILSIIGESAIVRGVNADDQVISSSVNNLFAGQKVKL